MKKRLASVIAADPDVSLMVRQIAGGQLDSLIDQAVPVVLARLAEDPEAVRLLVQGQSVGIASEAVGSTRDSAQRADVAVDSMVGKLLHRRAVPGGAAEPEGKEP